MNIYIYTTIVKTLNLLIHAMFLYICSFSFKTYKTPMRRNNSQTFPLKFHLLSSHKVRSIRSFPLLLPMSCLHKILFNHDGSKTDIHRLSTPRFGQTVKTPAVCGRNSTTPRPLKPPEDLRAPKMESAFTDAAAWPDAVQTRRDRGLKT